MTEELEMCNSCRHLIPTDERGGQCRRYPPQISVVVATAMVKLSEQWPYVARTDCCGEYQREPEEEN